MAEVAMEAAAVAAAGSAGVTMVVACLVGVAVAADTKVAVGPAGSLVASVGRVVCTRAQLAGAQVAVEMAVEVMEMVPRDVAWKAVEEWVAAEKEAAAQVVATSVGEDEAAEADSGEAVGT